jgi:hypothetical protein
MRCQTANAMLRNDEEHDLFVSFGDQLLDQGTTNINDLVSLALKQN